MYLLKNISKPAMCVKLTFDSLISDTERGLQKWEKGQMQTFLNGNQFVV